jgi:GR25 family glycosyltransferase involved in LPS biosynthesis
VPLHKIEKKMNFKCIIYLFLISFASLSADLEEYFKKPLDKPLSSQMRNIDFIYMINLDQRPEKFKSCTEELYPYNIHPYRFSAVNGWELSLEDINNVGVKFLSGMQSNNWGTCYLLEDEGLPHHEIVHVVGRNYFCHCMARGTIGIVLSHLSVLQDAYDSGYETIWVMEDDIHVIRNPHYLSELIDKLDEQVGKQGWDLLFTDQDTKNQEGTYVPCLSHAWRPNFTPIAPERFAIRYQISPDFKKIGARYGTYSMIVRRSGMKKILDFLKSHHIFLPYDMEHYLPSDMQLYTVIEDIVSTQSNAPSDNGGPNYLNNQVQVNN